MVNPATRTGVDSTVSVAAIDAIVSLALAEDSPWGDITSELLIPVDAMARAMLTAREPGVFSGREVFAATMYAVDPEMTVTMLIGDGARFERADIIARVDGAARSILRAERVALNFVQRMSGIATTTAAHVTEVVGTNARVVDTRKTTPGLRALERHAVRCGGGHNHRFSLSDAVLAKDNHLAVLTADGTRDLTTELRGIRAKMSHTTHFEVEVDRLDQIESVLAAGIDTIMLDNFSIEDLRTAVAMISGRATVEASGNVNLGTIGAIARTGVDIISVGALTHSARALDLGLDIVVATPAESSP